MSKISVTQVETKDATTPLTLTTGNTSAGLIRIEAANSKVGISGNIIGPVGINIDTPTSTLHVGGTANITSSLIVNGNTLVVDAVSGEVGIGILNPTANLHVVGKNIANTVNVQGNTVVSGAVYASAFVGLGSGFSNMNVISSIGYAVWNVPTGVRRWKVTAVGGGGTGGGSHALAGATGNGGGSGGLTIHFYDYVAGVDTMALNVGRGGVFTTALNANGASGNSTNVNYNNQWIFANAGTGGANSWFGANTNAIGIGGAASGGTINLIGDDGSAGGTAAATNPLYPEGGHTPLGWGQGGTPGTGSGGVTVGANGTNATGFGAGGAGGKAGSGTTTRLGGAGASGVVIIEW